MSEPFLAEVKIVGFNFAPRGWAECNGQILPINQNQSLYSLLGTTYGGDGETSFALPDLRGRTPMHSGNGFQLGQRGGEEVHTLSTGEIPSHNHRVRASTDNAIYNSPVPDRVFANSPERSYAESDPTQYAALASDAVGNVGGQAHNNMQPYIAVNFCIALQGLFPS